MKQFIRIGLPALLAMLLVSGVGQAGQTKLFKWVDAQGNVHFGDQAAARTDAEEMVVRTAGPSENAPAKDEGKAKQQPSKSNSEICKAAQKRLDEYQRAPFLYETGDDGKRHILPEQERQEIMDAAKEQVGVVCK
jgi:hypothetical protein